ncbi:DUF2513 domain-containing protein [Aeribacillus pallidus]|jgi:Hypothetical protein (DUF2513)|uniref:DUF2513 domain-containing protein n=1 Tax=Aeribacillus pallidus TaxID=33936 RepID=UPI003D23F99B
MRLNHDCVRDLLLELEDKLLLNDCFYLSQLRELDSFKKYGEETCIYALLKLAEAGFIIENHLEADNGIYELSVSSITWHGHEFLDNIRDPKIWKKVKDAASNLASTSVTILAQLGWQAVMNYLK